MTTRIYYIDEYDSNKRRWNLLRSFTNKREAISAATKTVVKGFPLRVRLVKTQIIYEIVKG